MNEVSERAKLVNEHSKWEGRKYAGKNVSLPHIGVENHVSVCVSVCVCLSVLRKCDLTFKGMGEFWWKFQGQSSSIQVILGGWPNPGGPQGWAMDQKMANFANPIFLKGFGPTGSWHTFLEMGAKGKQKIGSRFFYFCLGAWENWV